MICKSKLKNKITPTSYIVGVILFMILAAILNRFGAVELL